MKEKTRYFKCLTCKGVHIHLVEAERKTHRGYCICQEGKRGWLDTTHVIATQDDIMAAKMLNKIRKVGGA